jgi:hypothetical protein
LKSSILKYSDIDSSHPGAVSVSARGRLENTPVKRTEFDNKQGVRDNHVERFSERVRQENKVHMIPDTRARRINRHPDPR